MAKVYIESGKKTFSAERDLSSYQYYLMELGTSAGQVDLPDSDADLAIGVLLNDPKSGENAAIRLLNDSGTCWMVASAEILRGTLVVAAAVATAAGKIRTLPSAAGTYYIVGRALEAAALDGDIIEIELMPCIQRVVTQ